eukprot:3036571-Rhodomonas_salina.1
MLPPPLSLRSYSLILLRPNLPARAHDATHFCELSQVLDIGFGSGTSLVSMATAFPEANFLGVEIHKARKHPFLRAMSGPDLGFVTARQASQQRWQR